MRRQGRHDPQEKSKPAARVFFKENAMKGGFVFRVMMLVSLVILLPGGVLSQNLDPQPRIYCKHFLFGYPQGAPAPNPLIIRDLYALSMNGTKKFADWVCYYLTPHETRGSLDLERKWHNDPWLADAETMVVEPDEYKGARETGYDRGHMAPLASFKGSRFASQVNLYSNILPQKVVLNRGPWKPLEEKVRGLVDTYSHVWVMSGPLYERQMQGLPHTQKPHQVPSAFWMIVAASKKEYPKTPKDLQVAAFIMDQEQFRPKAKDNLVTVEDVEKRSKLNFFSQLSAPDQKKLESSKATSWVQEWLK